MFTKLVYWLLEFTSNYGYETNRQKRYKVGDEVYIGKHKKHDTPYVTGETVTIIETCRYDYLVVNNQGKRWLVYQFELEDKNKVY